MKCKNHNLKNSGFASIWPIVWLGLLTLASACRTERVSQRGPVTQSQSGSAATVLGTDATSTTLGSGSVASATAKGTDATSTTLGSGSVPTATGPFARIAIVGASVSAGFGGMPFGDAFTAAAPHSAVQSSANVMLFKDPVGETQRQLAEATAFKPSIVIALDLLFWDVYGRNNPSALANTLAQLDTLRTSGTWIVIGDVPLITTASEVMLPKDLIPSTVDLAAANKTIAAWAKKDHVVLVPLAAWTEPLRTGAKVKLPTGETVEAAELMAIDGLHANPLGTWYVLDKLDDFLETKVAGATPDALVFKRPN